MTRIESWATLGVPDVMFCAENGAFSFAELKVQHGNAKKVALSAHQVAWQIRHGHSNSFVVLRCSDLVIRAFAGRDSVDLVMVGIDAVEPAASFPEPYDWEAFYSLICPLD